MRLWISGGGTAGHVYPALTVLDASSLAPDQVTWFGRRQAMEEELVTRRGLEFRALGSGPLVGVGPAARVTSLARMVGGTLSAWRQVGRSRPDAVFVTGGYVSVPLALAAWMRSVPIAIFLPDVRPGKAVAALARLATVVATTASAALPHLPRGKAVVTGYPVRSTVRQADRGRSREHLGLAPEERLLLVFGGSQGALHINRAVAAVAHELVTRAVVLHVTGQRGHAEAVSARARLEGGAAGRWRIEPFLHDEEMATALAAADLVVCRAGAATLGELPARGLPAILVPLGLAGGHQAANAAVLADAGAARVVPDDQLDGRRLADEVARLLDDPAALRAMAGASRALDRPSAAMDIWRVIEGIVSRRTPPQLGSPTR